MAEKAEEWAVITNGPVSGLQGFDRIMTAAGPWDPNFYDQFAKKSEGKQIHLSYDNPEVPVQISKRGLWDRIASHHLLPRR